VAGPWMGILRLSHIFRQVCVKVWNPIDIINLQEDVAIILYLLKKVYFRK
jgi:hypothetical protein